MCVIAIKDRNVAMPTIEEMTNMWHSNPDGAGFMYAENGKVEIRKGFLELKDFLRAIEDFSKTHADPASIPMVMHFRIGTHGDKKSAACTHPFPVSSDDAMLTSTSLSVPIGFAHNGIISDMPNSTNLSDTMMYSKMILAPLYESCKSFYANTAAQWLIENTINGSRMCFMDGDGNITKVGRWHTDEETGLVFSNTLFKPLSIYDRYWAGYSSKSVSNSFRYPDIYRTGEDSGFFYEDDDYFNKYEQDKIDWFGEGSYIIQEEANAKCGWKDYKMDEEGVFYKRLSPNTFFQTFYEEVVTMDEIGYDELYVDEDGTVFAYDHGTFYSCDDIMGAYDNTWNREFAFTYNAKTGTKNR